MRVLHSNDGGEMNKEIAILELVKKALPNTTVRKSNDEYVFSLEGFYHTSWRVEIIDDSLVGRLPVIARYIARELFNIKLEGSIK